MRLLERTLVTVKIAKRACEKDALGDVREKFAYTGEARGSAIPVANTLNHQANSLTGDSLGVRYARTIKLLVARDVDLEPGDGVQLWGGDWVCEAVDIWLAHKEARLSRRI